MHEITVFYRGNQNEASRSSIFTCDVRKVITVDDVESVANIVPWLLSRTWDVNCVDIHLAHPPAATWWSRTRSRITVTYKFAFHAYSFTPVEFEITGVCGPHSIT